MVVKVKVKVMSKRSLRLVSPKPCHFCKRKGTSEDREWGVEETLGYEYIGDGFIQTGEKQTVLAEHVSLFEAQAIYAGAMQRPEVEMEIEPNPPFSSRAETEGNPKPADPETIDGGGAQP